MDELIQQAEESMPSCEDDNGDWTEFNRLKMQLESMSYIYTFIIAGPEADKKHTKDVKVDFWSVKGNEYRQFYDYMSTKHGSILKDREMRATACLLENIHQHVKKGIGLCVIKIILGKYKRISVSDNGEGFYNYKKQKQLSVKDAIKFGKGYGSRYKSMGQALATSFGLWSDFASVETPNDTAIIVPEGMFHKMARGLFKILCSLIVAVGADLATLMVREVPLSVIDIFIIISVFGIVMKWDKIKSVFGEDSEEKYFPQVRFKIKNKQKFGSTVTVYFCNIKGMKKWREEIIQGLKVSLKERAESFRSDSTP